LSLAWTPRGGDFAALTEEGITPDEAGAGLGEPVDDAVLLDGELGVAAARGLEAALGSEVARYR
jgi:hypothetical protein